MNAYDIYRTSKRVAGRLAAVGLTRESDRIVNAIRAGFTATEICMALRYDLRGILEDQPLPSELRRRIESLIEDIDELLGPDE